MLFGARQVGKTYALEQLGAQEFENCVHIDFSRNISAAKAFDTSLEPASIIAALEALTRQKIAPQKTLLILDEIQLCEKALTSLKYFCEDAPHYAVAAAGSLLGVKLREHGSFPVGKVDMMRLHPLSFEEYLWARNAGALSNLITEGYQTMQPLPLHEEALSLYREYLLVGGMPDVVRGFAAAIEEDSHGAYQLARSKQNEIDQAYLADIAKHAPGEQVPRIIEVWNSIPGQLAKENSKFQYKAIRTGARASAYEAALDWLTAAAIVSKCTRVSEPIAPLRAFEDPASFKLYRADTGLLASSFDALPEDVLPASSKAAIFRGAIAENYVMQQLVSQNVQPNYWGTASRQEIDFLARNKEGDIVPVEVKSGSNVRANSLEAYRSKYKPSFIARISTKNFGQEEAFRSIPLYAVHCLAKDLIASPLFV